MLATNFAFFLLCEPNFGQVLPVCEPKQNFPGQALGEWLGRGLGLSVSGTLAAQACHGSPVLMAPD